MAARRSGDLESLILFRIAAGKLPILPESIPPERQPVVNWDRLLALAALDNSVVVVARALATLPPGVVPATVTEQMERLSKVWRFRLTMLEQRLAETLALLRHAGIGAVLLKGSALAVTAYGSFASRPMADVDLLLDASRAEEAHELLQRSGWRWNTLEHPSHAYEEHHHLTPLTDSRGSGLAIEIHTEPLVDGHPFRFSADDVRASARTVTFAGVPVRVPEPHLHAVHAMMHLAWSHKFESGAWSTIRDIAMLLERGAISWPTLVETARRTCAESSCFWTLRLAQRLACVSVPDDTLDALRPAIREPVMRRLESHFVHLVLRDDRVCPSVAMRRRLWWAAMQPGAGARVDQREWFRTPRVAPVGVARRVFDTVQSVTRHALRAPRWTRYVASLVFPSHSL
jgi:Uncharacterised nucleotidyltransferase